jgi:uncharacterized protein RhaS with RHS repeats
MHARYYSPNLGRFMSVDPVGGRIGSSQSWNRYSYVENKPTGFVDPDGRHLYKSGAIVVGFFSKTLKRAFTTAKIAKGDKARKMQQVEKALKDIEYAKDRGDLQRIVQTDSPELRDSVTKQLDPNRKMGDLEQSGVGTGDYPPHRNTESGPYKDVHVQDAEDAKGTWTELAMGLAPMTMMLVNDPESSPAEVGSAFLWDATKAVDPIFLTDVIEWVFDVSP